MVDVVRHLMLSALASLAFCCWVSSANSQAAYPSQPIKLIVPAAAGGGPDVAARVVGKFLQERLQQPVVIENRPGAGSSIGAAAVTNSPANGYTFLVSDGAVISTNPLLYKQLSYDPQDLLPVATIARAPIFLAVQPSMPVTNMKEFVEYVRARPGQLNYGSSGIGTVHHFTMEAIKSSLHLSITHIPYRGAGESVAAFLGGQIDIVLAAYPSLRGFAADKRAKLLAESGPRRLPMAPEVPPLSDTIPGFDLASVYGFYARSGTPSAMVDKIASTLMEIIKDPDLVRQFTENIGIEPLAGGPAEFREALKSESERVANIVRTLGIEPQ